VASPDDHFRASFPSTPSSLFFSVVERTVSFLIDGVLGVFFFFLLCRNSASSLPYLVLPESTSLPFLGGRALDDRARKQRELLATLSFLSRLMVPP